MWRTTALAAAAAAALLALATANQPDVLFPHYAAPAECGEAGCRAWTASDAGLFADDVPEGGPVCAIPGAATDSATGGPETASSGPFCYCKATGTAAWCMPTLDIPEQINLM